MPYSKFSTKEVIKVFNLKDKKENLFDDIKLSPSDRLKEELEDAFSLEINSEKARSEFIIAPILLEIRRKNYNSFLIISGENLDVDEELGLNGECDFILAKKQTSILNMPIFGLVEAKKENIIGALGECIAQMIGARVFNDREKNSIDTIFGCITTGEIWQFLKLQNDIVTIDTKKYYIDNIEAILGVLQQIINFYEEN